MEYLVSVYIDENAPEPAPEAIEKIYKDVDMVNNELKDADAWVYGGGLHPTSSATTLRPQGDKVITTDGPFAETKEVLGGFWVIRADNLDSALEWANKCAIACQGTVELRPFQEEPEA